ncbi:MAG: hypothetical protein AB3N16_12815 [Flavobacteriaceae bacterium]
MAKKKLEVIKETELGNNCPECYNQSLQLSFYQRHKLGVLYHRTTKEVSHQIKCQKCLEVIYPVKWTDDIERIFEYYRKTVVPQKSRIRFTKWFYLLVLLSTAILGAAIAYSLGWLSF